MRLLTLRTILVATDLERSSDSALDSAHRLARAAGAALHVVHVAEPGNSGATTGDAGETGVRGALRRAGLGEEVKVHVIPGAPAGTIRDLASRLAADVIVIGPHRDRGDGGARYLGGTARAVAENATAPCLVTGRPLRIPLHRVLVPIDRSDTARGALLVGLSWASALRAGTLDDQATTLDVLHVDTDGRGADSVEVDIDAVRGEAGAWAGVDVNGVTERSRDVVQAIAQRSLESDADLVVMGTRGLGLTERAGLGSISGAVVASLSLPILLVPPAVWRASAMA